MRCILHSSIIVAEGVSRASVGVVLAPGNANNQRELGLMPCSHITLPTRTRKILPNLFLSGQVTNLPARACHFS